MVFLPQDGNFTSAGAIKAPDARPERLAFEAFFFPTAVLDEQGPRSIFPDALNPALFVNVWHGPPKAETGRPENVYSLDTAGLTQLKDADGEPVRHRPQGRRRGQRCPTARARSSWTAGSRWVKLQIGDTPGVPISLVALGFAVTGLCLSLFVRPRRVWVRVRGADEGRRVVEVGGLDRADARAGLS